MVCDRCGNEKFEVLWIKRNRLWSDTKQGWVYSDDYDTRKVVCSECTQQYLTETHKVSAIVYDSERHKPRFVKPREVTPR
jgi:ribosomal protein L37E